MVRPWANSLDMYRKVPVDILEGTKRGSILSYMSVLVMGLLFFLETKAFFQISPKTDLALDSNPDDKIRVNFNITMMDLRCDFAVVDAVSALGENQNVSSHVTKWNVDGEGIRQTYMGRNMGQQDLIELMDEGVYETLEELHEDGEDAISLDEDTLEFARRESKYLFVDFYASWCSHCMDLAPTWEVLAEVMTSVADKVVEATDERYHYEDYSDEEYTQALKLAQPVFIGKVDCVLHEKLCRNMRIRSYPSLYVFVDGKFQMEYRGDRTVLGMTTFLQKVEKNYDQENVDDNKNIMDGVHEAAKEMMEGTSNEEKEWSHQIEVGRKTRHHRATEVWNEKDHPGCQLYGYLLLDRVPGNFHIQARNHGHDIAPHMTNVSHVVHHFSVGEPVVKRFIEEEVDALPQNVKDKLAPMDGNAYVSKGLHEGFSHYLKVVTTNMDGMKIGKNEKRAYQILQSSQITYYRTDIVPEAKFIYDLSPISVSYGKAGSKWCDYLTSLMAIVGGTFTVVGMLEGSIRAASAKTRR